MYKRNALFLKGGEKELRGKSTSREKKGVMEGYVWDIGCNLERKIYGCLERRKWNSKRCIYLSKKRGKWEIFREKISG